MDHPGGASHYDEDLIENPFFKDLCIRFPDAYSKAVSDGWVICIPRSGSYKAVDLTDSDILSHILVPDSDDHSSFHTITNKHVKKKNNAYILEEDGAIHEQSVHILFTETCYSEELKKHDICCLERPLCTSGSPYYQVRAELQTLSGMHDCLSFLWSVGNGHSAVNAVNRCCGMFVESHPNLKVLSLQQLWEKVGQLYSKALKVFCEKGHIVDQLKEDFHFAESVKLALETYVLYLLYQKLMECLLAITAVDDAKLNKTIQNLQELQPCDLGIRPVYEPSLQSARQQMQKLTRQHHPLGKFLTLRRVTREFDQQPHNSDTTSSSSEEPPPGTQLSSDDLLPIFIYLVLHTSIASWTAQLVLMKMFHFSASSCNHDQYGFLAATLEAALEHIKSGALGDEEPLPEALADEAAAASSHENMTESSSESTSASGPSDNQPEGAGTANSPPTGAVSVPEMFHHVARDDAEALAAILDSRPESEPPARPLCHPLCTCSECRLAQQRRAGVAPTVASTDGAGRTALHLAASHSSVRCIELLTSRGAVLDARDLSGATPLHCAAARGHQGAALLLLHLGASAGRRDARGNTALHLAVNNGHRGAAQALLYHAEQTGAPAGVNALNADGDAPLHLAARWGYGDVALLLAAHGAARDVVNHRGLTPLDVAHDHVLRRHLVDACDRFRRSAPKRLVRLRGAEPTRPLAAVTSPPAGRAVRRLFAAIAAGDERLACFHLGLTAGSDGSALCHPLCACSRCAPLAAQRSAAPVPISCQDSSGRTPLHAAASAKLPDLTRLLLDSGADPNPAATDGSTPLHCACAAEFVPGAAELIARGADVCCADTAGRTALHVAAGRRNADLCRRLLRAGADRTARCARGLTPLDHAGKGRQVLSRVFVEMAGKAAAEDE
ncbi:ankyrin repeat domain-containing protein 27-like [Amphibalanus amphitrite]|uniref:ankyrin repeat domain-containing protein 27-like n=1 Tax=Amphibalanus amphitrite TaxID=1232801 RepID=UPI001C90B789|nr:ankyrin repeat domain-containing protein 27-like [Amphibalanus amphitrite]